MTNGFFGVFSWNNSQRSVILTKWKIISKSQWNQKYFSKSHLWFVWTRNVVESWYFSIFPEKNLMTNRFFCVFGWKNSKSSIILTKWKVISKSQWNQKYFSKSHLWFVWTRNVVESWYFWQIRLWNSHGLLVFMENPFFEL